MSTGNQKFRQILQYSCVFYCSLLICCASQSHPAGGLIDKDPPRIARCVPEPGSVNITGRLKITCVFSEWIDPRLAKQSISIFPPLADGFRVDVNGRTIEITSKSELAESTTYHFEISAALQDLHGISIGTPFHFVFSTGSVLDSGQVHGCIVSADMAARQAKVALFRRDSSNTSDTVFFGLPSYLAQTDTHGVFEMNNIRRGTYDILAFVDADNNSRLASGTEQAFAPMEKRFSLDSSAGPFTLHAVNSDSAVKHIASLTPLSSKSIMGQWETGIRTDDTAIAGNLTAIVAVDSSDTIPPLSITGYQPVANTTRFVLRLDTAMKMTPYYLIYSPQAQILSDSGKVPHDTIRFNGISFADTILPVIQATEPSGLVSLMPRITITWSEPVRPLKTSWSLADTSGDTIRCTCDTLFRDTTVFTLPGNLKPGQKYSLSITDSMFADLSGNRGADTATASDTSDTAGTRIEFITIPEDKLCISLSGGSTCLAPDARRIWRFMPFGVKAFYECADSASSFCFDSIPSGKGVLGYFIDADGNGRYTHGRLVPWHSPEITVTLRDTIEARERWDITGIIVNECDLCPKPAGKGNPPNPDLRK
jgi:hypothetical protein